MSDISNEQKGQIQKFVETKGTFQVGFMDIIPATTRNIFTSENNLLNYILIVDAYSKIPQLYGMDRIHTEKVMDKLDTFQSRFGKIGEFGWWGLEIISADAGMQFNPMEFKN